MRLTTCCVLAVTCAGMKSLDTASHRQAEASNEVGSPESVLRVTLLALPELEQVASELFEIVPQARSIALRLCEYLMQAVPFSPDDDVSLLERCFETGLRAVHSNQYELVLFVRGLLQHVHYVAGWHVFARRRNHTIAWDCCTGSLHAWLVFHGSPRLRVSPRPIAFGESTPTSLTRAIIACRVLCADDLLHLGPGLHSVVFSDA